jgi:hypothetical protein
MSLDLLAIDTFSFTPHLETSGEICINERLAGSSVGFVFIYVDNPDDTPCSPLLARFGRHKRKVHKLQRLLSAEGVTQVAQPRLANSAFRDAGNFARNCLATMDELKNLSYKGAALGIGAASSLISFTGDEEPDVSAHSDLINRYLRASALVFEAACVLIPQYQPKSVLVFNGRLACARAIVEAARQFEVSCLLHERGATFQRYEIFDREINNMAYMRQRVRHAWDQAGIDREALGRSFFHRRHNGDGIGWTSFIGDQERGSVPARGASRRLVYFSSNNDEYATACEMEHALFESQREAVRFLIEWVGQQTNVELVIRVHPGAQTKSLREREWWDSLTGANVKLESSASKTDSYALAESADTVLTYSSSMGVEASFFGKPVILLGDTDYRGLGCAYEPETLEDLEALLAQTALLPKHPESALPYGYYSLTFGREYRIYQPFNLFEGSFMGSELAAEPKLLGRLKASKAGQSLKMLRARIIK